MKPRWMACLILSLLILGFVGGVFAERSWMATSRDPTVLNGTLIYKFVNVYAQDNLTVSGTISPVSLISGNLTADFNSVLLVHFSTAITSDNIANVVLQCTVNASQTCHPNNNIILPMTNQGNGIFAPVSYTWTINVGPGPYSVNIKVTLPTANPAAVVVFSGRGLVIEAGLKP